MKILRNFHKNRKTDKNTLKDQADAVLVTAIISMPFIMIAFGFAADTAKNIYVSNTYTTKAQAAVETAVKSIDARGSLNNNSVQKFITEFEKQSGSSDYQTNEAQSFESKTCSTAKIDNVERKLPYYEVKLGSARGNDSAGFTSLWKIEDGQQFVNKPLNKVKYKVISVDVYNGSQNIILGMFGQPCQLVKSSVSAISFAGNADLM